MDFPFAWLRTIDTENSSSLQVRIDRAVCGGHLRSIRPRDLDGIVALQRNHNLHALDCGIDWKFKIARTRQVTDRAEYGGRMRKTRAHHQRSMFHFALLKEKELASRALAGLEVSGIGGASRHARPTGA